MHAFDKLRFGDTDRQDHVNNALYATLFETGRVELLYDSAEPVRDPGSALVIARLIIDDLSGFQRRIARSGDAPPGAGGATTRYAKGGWRSETTTSENTRFQK